jgi:hypothetical protein
MTAYWGDSDIEPAPLKRQCSSCGRAEFVDKTGLCVGCREDFDREMDDYYHDEPEPDLRSMYQGHTKP